MKPTNALRKAKFHVFEHDPVPDSCWSLSTGPDGRIYAASCCESTPGGSVRIVRYNDQSDALDTLVDVAEVVAEPRTSGRATQCKIHYSFAPSARDGILYAATHLSAPGFGQRSYSPWADWRDETRSFPRSWLLAWDCRRDTVAWTAPFIPREGCRCLALDDERGRLYTISYPRDHFWIYDLKKRTIRSLGRLGSVNSQAIFTDKRGRVFTSNDQGQIVRYSPDTDTLEELPVYVPHAPGLTPWHCVFYDVVASPDGECVYGVPWNTNPHLFRYWPGEGAAGRMEDLGPVHQPRDMTVAVPYYMDHCGGLVFGADGMLYYATSRWEHGAETLAGQVEDGIMPTQGVVIRFNPATQGKTEVALLERPGGQGHYVSRAARDRHGDLFFGQVTRPLPVGLSRLTMDARGDNLHLPLRTWG